MTKSSPYNQQNLMEIQALVGDSGSLALLKIQPWDFKTPFGLGRMERKELLSGPSHLKSSKIVP